MFLQTNFLNSLIIDEFSKKKFNFYLNSINNALMSGFNSIKPKNIIKSSISLIDDHLVINNDILPFSLKNTSFYIIGGGKATYEIVEALIPLLGLSFKSGIINIPENQMKINNKFKNLSIFHTGHPFPNKNTFIATKKQLDLIEDKNENEVIFVVITGGASALLEHSDPELSYDDIILTYQLLVKSGLSINQINSIRKHLSTIKGGKLVFKTKAHIIGLLVSDVLGDELSTIGSGPTCIDNSTFTDAYGYLKEANLIKEIPKSVLKLFELGLNGLKEETVKFLPFNRFIKNFLLSSNKTILSEIQNTLSKYKIDSEICSTEFSGESKEIGEFLFNYCSFPYTSIPKAFIYGGESFVTIRKDEIPSNSLGGRNQELILSFIISSIDKKCSCDFLIVSLGTDGIDGNSEYAGAFYISNIEILNKNKLNKDLINHNSSNSLPNYCYIKTGPTGTNVADIILLLKF